MSYHTDTDSTPPEVLGPTTGVRTDTLPDFDVFSAISAQTTDTLKRLSRGET